jgi:hypothetical protein
LEELAEVESLHRQFSRKIALKEIPNTKLRFQMAVKKVVNKYPGGTHRLRIVVSPSIKEWLSVTVVRTWIDEQLV